MRSGVYVLALRHGGYYVGRSKDIDARLRQHHDGSGSAWCRHQGGVIGEVATVHAGNAGDLASWEMNETVAQMLMHGFENVRGWEFTNCASLSFRECDTIKTIVMGQGNMCRRCGGEGHFATHCDNPIRLWLQDLEKLQAQSTSVVMCAVPARNAIACAAMAYESRKSRAPDAGGQAVHDVATTEVEHVVPVTAVAGAAAPAAAGRGGAALCQRCGRDSHTAATCFAHKHFTGADLKPRIRPGHPY